MFGKLKELRKIKILKFIQLNYFSKQIIRDKGVYLIPYKRAVLDLSKNCKIIIKGKNLVIGANRLRGSKTETFVRMEGGAVWKANNGGLICYNSTIEIKDKGVLESGFFYLNSGSVIISSRSVTIGESVWIGRDNTIYDNDHHRILDDSGGIKNPIKPVFIGDNVWITNHVSILKGTNIGSGSVISAYTVVRQDVPEHCLVGNINDATIFDDNVKWSYELIL